MTVVSPTTGKATCARAIGSQIAGHQLVEQVGTGLKIMVMAERENVDWVRGWNTKEADAFRVAVALS